MLGIAVLLPLTLGGQWWLEQRDLSQAGTIPPAAPLVEGTSVELAGTHWEFLGAQAEAEPQPGVRRVDVGFLVTPEDDVAGERLYSHCWFRAKDDQGRTWEQLYSFDQGEDAGTTGGGSCATGDFSPIPGGTEELLAASFEVPEEAVQDLRFEIEVATHDPELDIEPGADPGDLSEVLEEFEELAVDNDPTEDGVDLDANPPRPVAASFAYREFED
ncbi:hypothetical protein RIF23_05100 [Lipingzhangella sp. LS1_29]|uniref:Uncharacterized protein n=2 Tax=Lipingzhangella rawalii TaxID=2055835 RepID=A0ABU2H2Y8_9ACTN|nr:hypothetical protein [Lipingzhangella rawalii]